MICFVSPLLILLAVLAVLTLHTDVLLNPTLRRLRLLQMYYQASK